MKKIILSSTVILFLNMSISPLTQALTLDEVRVPRDLMGRMGNSNTVEERKQANLKQAEDKISKKAQIEDEKYSSNQAQEINATTSYADLSLKKLANDVSYELELDELTTSSDLSILWNAATERSETMKYTIYKLSNPDEDKPDESTIKKILKPIANLGSVAGATAAGDPFVATGALIGGGLINAFMKDDKEINYQFSKVSDADMILLIRKIDTLQKKLIDLYMDYKTKQQIYKMEKDNFKKREEIYRLCANKTKEELTIADVYYRSAKIRAQKAQDEYLTSRAILENLVGIESLQKIENEEDVVDENEIMDSDIEAELTKLNG